MISTTIMVWILSNVKFYLREMDRCPGLLSDSLTRKDPLIPLERRYSAALRDIGPWYLSWGSRLNDILSRLWALSNDVLLNISCKREKNHLKTLTNCRTVFFVEKSVIPMVEMVAMGKAAPDVTDFKRYVRRGALFLQQGNKLKKLKLRKKFQKGLARVTENFVLKYEKKNCKWKTGWMFYLIWLICIKSFLTSCAFPGCSQESRSSTAPLGFFVSINDDFGTEVLVSGDQDCDGHGYLTTTMTRMRKIVRMMKSIHPTEP